MKFSELYNALDRKWSKALDADISSPLVIRCIDDDREIPLGDISAIRVTNDQDAEMEGIDLWIRYYVPPKINMMRGDLPERKETIYPSRWELVR